MINLSLSRDFNLSITNPSESTEGFKIEVYSEILSKYNRVIASVCFDKKQTKQVPLSFMDGESQEIFISDIYNYEVSKSIDIYCICCNNVPLYDDISSNTVEIEIPPKKDAILIYKEFNENGDYKASDDNADGYSDITINIPDQSKDILNSLIDRSITTITSDVVSIGAYVFFHCSDLTEVNFPNVTSIEGYAFQNCSALTEADFPNVTSIGDFAFQNCTSLSEVNFPSASRIGKCSFYGCTSLTEADFPNVTSIGESAFRNSTTLTEVNFPNVTSIEGYAFQDCSALTEADFPNVTSLQGVAFMNCSALTEVNFPEVQLMDGGEIFMYCTSLSEVSFPKVYSINGVNTFYGCTSLSEVNFPSASRIGKYSFYGCTSLTYVNFPKVDEIMSQAFANCTNLTYFDMSEVQRVPRLDTNSFSGTYCYFLFRDQEQLDEYAGATNWSTLADRFQIKGATT